MDQMPIIFSFEKRIARSFLYLLQSHCTLRSGDSEETNIRLTQISFEARSGANKETSIRFEPKQASADRMEWNNKETEDWSRKLNTHHHFLNEENRRILLYLLQVALNFKKRWQQSYKHETEANQASKDQMEQQIRQRMM